MGRSKAPKFECVFCDGECAVWYYALHPSLIKGLLELWKVCAKHEAELERREIERTVA